MDGVVTIFCLCLYTPISLAFGDEVDQRKLLIRMQEEMIRMRQQISELQGEVKLLKNNRSGDKTHQKRLLIGGESHKGGVAFSSYLSSTFSASNFGTRREIVYDKVECNAGNGYDNNTGSFHAPVSGIYALTWTTCAGGDSGEMGIELMINNQIHGLSYVDSEVANDEECSTGFIIHRMNAGDVAFTRSQHTGSGSIRSDRYMRTTFSGWLLF